MPVNFAVAEIAPPTSRYSILSPIHTQSTLDSIHHSTMSIPSPRARDSTRSSRSSTSSHMRRPSLPISPALSPRVIPVPIPQRHGSIVSRSKPSIDVGSLGSVFSSSFPSSVICEAPSSLMRNEEWLDTPAEDILSLGKEEQCPLVSGEKGTEDAVDVSEL